MRTLAAACAIQLAMAASAAPQSVPVKPKPIALLRHNIERIAQQAWLYFSYQETGRPPSEPR